MTPCQPHLAAEGYRTSRIDGKMTHKQRQAELKKFSTMEAGGTEVRALRSPGAEPSARSPSACGVSAVTLRCCGY